jgi:hypothetical protein
MIEEHRLDDRFLILSAYVKGSISRERAMQVLGLSWYGDLRQAATAAGLSIKLPAEVHVTMRKSAEKVFGTLGEIDDAL